MLSERLIRRLKGLHLLDDDETIYHYYSNYRRRVTGNFVSDKRVATYYFDDKNGGNDEIAFAYYENIYTMDTYPVLQISGCQILNQ